MSYIINAGVDMRFMTAFSYYAASTAPWRSLMMVAISGRAILSDKADIGIVMIVRPAISAIAVEAAYKTETLARRPAASNNVNLILLAIACRRTL